LFPNSQRKNFCKNIVLSPKVQIIYSDLNIDRFQRLDQQYSQKEMKNNLALILPA